MAYSKSLGQLVVTKAVIGINTLASYGKDIGRMIGLPEDEYNRLTGHTKRRTSITAMAEAGMTVCQIKAATGHKSDQVVQLYIDNSMKMKRLAAAAVQCNTSREEEETAGKRVCV